MTALFTTVFLQQWTEERSRIPALLGLTVTLACRILFGRDLFLIPSMIFIIGGLTALRRRIEPEVQP